METMKMMVMVVELSRFCDSCYYMIEWWCGSENVI